MIYSVWPGKPASRPCSSPRTRKGERCNASRPPSPRSRDPSRKKDLLPYREAVAAGVPAVMTAHLLVPQWDDLPATLSAVALRGWLRQRLGFKGVIITDDLEMKGITNLQPLAQAGREALLAGADLLLICNNWQAVWDTVRVLEEAGDLA